MSSGCVSCNTAPPPCDCKPTETCVQTSRNCTTCPQNICIPSAASGSDHSSSAGLGGTIGGAVGGAAAGLLIIFSGWLLYKRNILSALFPTAFATRQASRNPLKSRRLFLKSSMNPNHHLKPSTQAALATALSPNQQSVVYLPTAQSPHSALSCVNPDHKSTSIDSHHASDDDPFSDRNSGLSLTNQRTNRSSMPTQNNPQPTELMPPTSQQSNLIPIAYIPPASKSVSISDNGDRDGTDAGAAPSTPTQTDQRKSIGAQVEAHERAPTLAISNSNVRSSFLPNNSGGLLTPPLTGNPTGPFKPVRPHRAPDLDLRLPTDTAPGLASPTVSIATTGPASSVGATIGPSTRQSLMGAQLAPPIPAVSQFSVDSSSEATHSRAWSHQSALSLPASPSLTRHNIGSTDGMPAGSRLSFESSQPTGVYRDSVHRPLSSVSDATTHDSHLSSILDPAMIVTPVTLVRTASGRQAAVQRVALRGQEKARVVRLPPSSNMPHQPSLLSPVPDAAESSSSTGSPAETLGPLPTPGIGRFAPPADNTRMSSASLMSEYAARHSQISPSQPSPLSAGLGEFDFESTVATVAGSAPQTTGNPFSDAAAVGPGARSREGERRPGSGPGGGRVGQLRMTRSSFGSSVDESFMDEDVEFPTVLGRTASGLRAGGGGGQQQMALKALGRDRTISLSSMITAEASSGVGTGPVPPLPTGKLPEPFKPFAGQRPRGTRKGEQTASVASSGGLSMVSSIRSGYGSVLEGIPFNIEFNSEGDEFFGGPSSSRGSIRTESGSEMGEEQEEEGEQEEDDDGVGTVVGGGKAKGGSEGSAERGGERRREGGSASETETETAKEKGRADGSCSAATASGGGAGGSGAAGTYGRRESEEFGREAMAALAFVGE